MKLRINCYFSSYDQAKQVPSGYTYSLIRSITTGFDAVNRLKMVISGIFDLKSSQKFVLSCKKWLASEFKDLESTLEFSSRSKESTNIHVDTCLSGFELYIPILISIFEHIMTPMTNSIHNLSIISTTMKT